MANVSNLVINIQTGSDTLYATWTFNETTKSTTTGFKKGDLVSIKSGAKYYNGVSIPSWVMNDQWYLTQVKGDRAVLGKNKSGSSNIQSPINTKYLNGGSNSSSSSSVSESTVDHYEVKWTYDTGDGVWFEGSSSDVTVKNATYSPPANSVKVKVSVKPVSKTKNQNGKETSYWTGTTKTAEYKMEVNPPEDLSAPSVSLDKYKLTAEINNVSDARTDKIQFEVYEGDVVCSSGKVTVLTQRASYNYTTKPGGKYRVRCRAINLNGTAEIYGDWSSFSNEITTIPDTVSNVKCNAETETSVKVTWDAVSTATSYTVEYTTNKDYFDTSSEVQSTTVEFTTAYVTNLDSGDEWFFRVKSTNETGDSGWSSIVSTSIGKKPEAPTTWSLTTTALVGDDITLYWVHNCEDGSKMSESNIRMEINGDIESITVQGTTPEDDVEPTYSYTFNPSSYGEGAEILWKVRTKGIIDEWSDWSTQRTIKVYAPPVLEVNLNTDEDGQLTSFPLTITSGASPDSQIPITYHISIVAKDTYETVDNSGNPIIVTSGTELYSKILNTSDRELELDLSAGDVTLASDSNYDLTMTVSMDSGLTATNTSSFIVNWEDYIYIPDASISIDESSLSAYISPFCVDDEGNMVENVTLSVYRREYNGTFTLLASELQNTGVDTITDPHPSLDSARYRIVTQHTDTGSIGFEDLPGVPIGEPGIVIQWDEHWSNFDYVQEGTDELATPLWNGSMVRLPYNVDISENYSVDNTLVKYIGRKNPVTYYGTQIEEGGEWSTVILRDDKETLYALRRLAVWPGDVYIREPSGIGYWAQVKISLSTKNQDLIIPVSIDVTKVEGDSI